MKLYSCIFVILIIQFATQVFADNTETNSWGPVNDDIQMSIRLKSDVSEIKTNQPVELLIGFKNVSTNETLRISTLNAIETDPGYSWIVTSPSGKDISPVPDNMPVTGSGARIPLPPGQIIEFNFNLSLLCEFNEIGTYKIVAKKSIYSPSKHKLFKAVSNPLNIVVSN